MMTFRATVITLHPMTAPSSEIALAHFYSGLASRAYAEADDLFESGGARTVGYLVEQFDLQFAGVGVDTDEIGRDGVKWTNGQPDNLEPTASYKPAVAVGKRGKPGEFQRLSKDPTWQDNYATVLEGLSSGDLALKLHNSIASDQLELATRQMRAIERALTPLINHQFRREWASALNDGFALWELVGDPVTKLAYRRAWTVDAWILDENERVWEATSFETPGDSATKYEIPAEKLLLYSHNRTGMNLSGEPQLRFAAPHILIKQELVRLDMQAVAAHGLGWRVIESVLGTPDAADDKETVKVLSSGRASDNPTIQLTPGHKLNWISPAGTLPDFAARMLFHEASIEKSLGARAARLEKSTYANAELIDRVDRRTVRHYGSLFAQFVTDELIPVLARQLFDAPMPTPTLEFDLASDAASAAILVQLIQTGVITPTAADEDAVRRQYNLPARTATEVTP